MSFALGRAAVRVALLLITLIVLTEATTAAPIWTMKGAKWYSLMETGNVAVGMDTGIAILDGASGKTLWQRNDLGGVKEEEYSELPGTPLLLISDNSGWMQKKTKITAVDTLTGVTVWQTEKMVGFTVEVTPVYNRDMVVFMTIQDNRMNKDKPDIFALRLSTGELLWKAEYSEKVDLYGIERKKRGATASMLFGSGGGGSNRFDLKGENPPIVDNDSLYMTYAGLHRYNLTDGTLVWKTVYDVTDGSLKNTNGQAVFDGDVIYTSAKGVIRAIDKNSGAIRWTTKDFGKGGIAEMQLQGDVIYCRMGGQFFSSKKGEWEKKGPIGVVALNKNTGTTNWIYSDAKNSITNMMILPDDNTLLIGDEKNLIGLDLSSQGKVKETYKIPLKFKFKVGAAATVGKIAGIAMGGVGGFFKKGPDTTDNPVSLVRQENGTVVVRGMQHLIGFNPKSRDIAWSTKYDAPGISGWQSIVLTALTVTSALLSEGMEASYSQRGDFNSAYQQNTQFLNLMSAYQQQVARKYSAAKQTGNVYYVLTTIKGKDAKGKDEKGSGLVGVNLYSGQPTSQILFNDKQPDYEVDDASGRLYNMKDGVLSAYQISEPVEQAPNDDGKSN